MSDLLRNQKCAVSLAGRPPRARAGWARAPGRGRLDQTGGSPVVDGRRAPRALDESRTGAGRVPDGRWAGRRVEAG
ncbi:hypothetical protein GCM10023082_03270 [Streptomyces tremellae]|uniref:Uncharacterized protein n=1 Tax=Streptomyces tremellae TaxID=1124239 RepID=A0ABP7DPV3_9ACTN